MSDIQFIRTNPGIESFQQGTRHAQDLMSQDILNDARMQDIVERRAGMPSRLRQVEASADLARTNADVAGQTAPYDVQILREQAAQAPIQTQAATRTESEMAATSGDRVQQSGQRTRLGDIGVQNAELDSTYKVFDLLDQGDTEGARHVAAQLGVDIPDGVIGNRQLIRQLKALGDRARTLYPNSPRRQQIFLEEGTNGLVEGTKANANRADPTYPFRVENAPEPDMNATSGRGLQFDVMRQAAIDLGYSPEEAFQIASGRKPPSETELVEIARKLVEMEMPSGDISMPSPEQRRQRYEQILSELRSTTSARAPTATQPAPAAPVAATPSPGTGDNVPAPRDPAQRVVGQVYTAPDGRKVRWRGDGWELVP